ncbi:hypothetical protein IK146_03355 [Candidatus Saccharibacteria bacterium]|nr:hypothetical protein [Candidatus Saccharibacteria bacterium]
MDAKNTPLEKAYRLDTISFEPNENVKRVSEILRDAKGQCFGPLGGGMTGSTSGVEKGSGDVLLFIPLSDMRQHKEEKVAKFYATFKQLLEQAGFTVTEEMNLDNDRFLHVGFSSHYFRIEVAKA